MIRNEWDNLVGRRNERFTWNETLRMMAFSHHTNLKSSHGFGKEDKWEADPLRSVTLNLIVDKLLRLPNLFKAVTGAFATRTRIVVPATWPGPPPEEAQFDWQDVNLDYGPAIYTIKVVTFRRHTLTIEVGNAYVPPKRFDIYAGPGFASIDAMYDRGRTVPLPPKYLYQQPVPPELQLLVDQLTPFLEWVCYCISVMVAKHPLLGLARSETRSGRSFHMVD